jgi:hypothetical protein
MMRTHRNALKLARFEQLATALGLNVALAGMVVMTASAFDVLDARFLWLYWAIVVGVTSCLTLRRVSGVLAPLFWRCTTTHPVVSARSEPEVAQLCNGRVHGNIVVFLAHNGKVAGHGM